ncbi:CPBP family intramembrane metalloprotease [Candidatus Hepatincolaceae symbiont of Richtersius coronifer]
MLISITYSLLFITIITLWLPSNSRIKIWQVTAFLALSFAYLSNLITEIGILVIGVYGILCILYAKNEVIKRHLLLLPVLVMGGIIAKHFLPGFNNLLILSNFQFTADALPFTLYLNIDKAFSGILLAGFVLQLSFKKMDWIIIGKALKSKLPIVLITVLGISYLLGYVKFSPKLPDYFLIWMVSNLLITCLAEEALFRGILQNHLSQLTYRYSSVVAILIPALIFGALHYSGGIKYVALTSIAGLLYGWIYNASGKRIEASILAHFAVNLLHILFFTYPALRSAFN